MTGRILCQYPVEPGNYSSFIGKGGVNLNASSCYCVVADKGVVQNHLKMCVTSPISLLIESASTIMLKSGKYGVALSFSERL